VLAACLACAWLLAGAAVADSGLDAERALSLARAQWFEGIPDAEIAPLSADAVAALADLLADPDEAATHANAVDLLGRGGGPGAFEALADFAADEPEGEVDGAVYRARLALPFALGYLARDDDRALALLAQAVASRSARGWHYRHIDGARMARLLRTNAVTGLALSGRDASAPILAEIARGDDDALRAHAAEMQALHAWIRGEAP